MGENATFTAFAGSRQVASGTIESVAEALAALNGAHELPNIFDDDTGQPVELDLRFGPGEAANDFHRRMVPPAVTAAPEPPRTRGPGRPRLGVVAREVTLLPRHWDWLASQPGGASAALRRLVDDARRGHAEADRARGRREAAYRVMSALGGDLPGFEEASRALFAGDLGRLGSLLSAWPSDVGAYVMSFLQDPR